MPKTTSDWDVIVVGAGPGGLSAAIWCRDLGLRVCVLEGERTAGGQLLKIYNPIRNYPGINAPSGLELCSRFLETAGEFEVAPEYGTPVTSIALEKGISIRAANRTYHSRFLIFATGVRRRTLDVPGEADFAGKGIINSGSGERSFALDKTVAIVGGGDAALENAVILSEFAARIYVIHRRDSFSGRDEFVREASARSNVEFILDSKVTAIEGSESLEAIIVQKKDGTTQKLPIDLLLIRVGVRPNSELLKNIVDMDAKGYILIDHLARTSVENIYAVGDVANPVSPTIATAVGTGATASKHIRTKVPPS